MNAPLVRGAVVVFWAVNFAIPIILLRWGARAIGRLLREPTIYPMRYPRFALLVGIQLAAGIVLLLVMPPLRRFKLIAPDVSNCFVYVADQYRQHGGIVRMVQSEWGWWFHFHHSVDGIHWTEFTTDDKFARAIPPLLFAGYARAWTVEVAIA